LSAHLSIANELAGGGIHIDAFEIEQGVRNLNVEANREQDGAAPEKMKWQTPELIKLDADLTGVENGPNAPSDASSAAS
jgi:hypothetical protein